MFLTFEELFTIEGMKQAKLAAGNEGTHRLIKGAHVVELIDAEKWIKAGELLFISGVGLENARQDLFRIIQDVSEKGAAGIVVEVGPYIKEITDDVKELADHLEFPVLALPFEVNISDIISKVFYMIYEKEKGNKALSDFMKEAMLSNENKDLEDKARLLGYDALKGHIAVVWSITSFSKENKHPIELEQALPYIRDEFSLKEKILYLIEGSCISIIVPYSRETKAMLGNQINKVCVHLKKEFGNMSVNVGVGTQFHQIRHLRASVSAAKKALNLLAFKEESINVCYYDEMGIYRIFVELKKQNLLKEVMAEEIGVLISYDEKNNTELVHTLELYIQAGCNISKATELLFVHRNTVKQRIKRISELLDCDLSDSNEIFNLQLALKIKQYLNR
ncbi:MAG: PucR family transcriptional regulator ligand-binding domain-containing protein [bacterium]|nr:PucR family transcriptional regulator ligand-binding domain-containing protein [bacterium]